MFFYTYKEKMDKSEIEKCIEFMGAYICDSCGKEILPEESAYRVGVIIDGLPDTRFYCDKCSSDIKAESREEYHKRLNQMFEESEKRGGTPLDVFDI